MLRLPINLVRRHKNRNQQSQIQPRNQIIILQWLLKDKENNRNIKLQFRLLRENLRRQLHQCQWMLLSHPSVYTNQCKAQGINREYNQVVLSSNLLEDQNRRPDNGNFTHPV